MDKVARYVLGSFFFGALAAGGAYAGFAVVKELPLAMASEEWPATSGTVTESKAYLRRKGHAKRHRLTYSYEIGNRYFDGKRIAFMGSVFGDSPQTRVRRYPEGRRVTVYYAPSRPGISVLEPGVRWTGFLTAVAVGSVFLAFGLAGLWATFRR